MVSQFGLIGVTIGTIVAMTIRTIEFVYHTNKYIIGRSIWESIKKILLVIIETIIIIIISKILPILNNTNYINLFINSIMVFLLAITVTCSMNVLFFRKELKEGVLIFKRMLKKKK